MFHETKTNEVRTSIEAFRTPNVPNRTDDYGDVMARKKTTRKRIKRLLSEAKRKEIIAIVSIGGSRESAAKYVRCSPSTIKTEMKNDPAFAEEIRSAEEKSEIFFLQKIRAAADKAQYWRAAAWALERRCPNRYAVRGAKTLSEDQVLKLVTDLTEIVVPEISDPREREKIIEKVRNLLATFERDEADAEMPAPDGESRDDDFCNEDTDRDDTERTATESTFSTTTESI